MSKLLDDVKDMFKMLDNPNIPKSKSIEIAMQKIQALMGQVADLQSAAKLSSDNSDSNKAILDAVAKYVTFSTPSCELTELPDLVAALAAENAALKSAPATAHPDFVKMKGDFEAANKVIASLQADLESATKPVDKLNPPVGGPDVEGKVSGV